MRNSLRFLAGTLIATGLFSSCSHHAEEIVSRPPTNQEALLNTNQKMVIEKFKMASYVLEEMFKDKKMRHDFNSFISAKLKRTISYESLTLQEVFNARTLKLDGVYPDFLKDFKRIFIKTIISGNFENSQKIKKVKFKNELEVARYFGLRKIPQLYQRPQLSNLQYVVDDNGIPYEIYCPYSENFPNKDNSNYTITHHPLVTKESNTGQVYTGTNGTRLKKVTVDDDYAYDNPTYILTYDDGLRLSDFKNGKKPLSARRYLLYLPDENYDLIKISEGNSSSGGVAVTSGTCNTELRVKDGRWTKLGGFGLFEGKIEFAVAVSKDISGVIIPGQGDESKPIINIDKKAQAWGYIQIKRKKVRKMQKGKSEFVSHGLYVSKWCPGDEAKMLILYEYDRPNFLSRNSKEISGAFAGAASLIKDSATQSRVSAFTSMGLTPIVKATLEGTSTSQKEYFSIIGSKSVWENHKKSSNGTIPTNINGYRLYGNNEVNVTFEMD